MNKNHPLFGIENKRPVRVIRYWPYEKAYVRRPTGENYTFDFMFLKENTEEKLACAELREFLAELYRKQATEGFSKGEPKENFPGVSRYKNEVWFTPDNKEVYLYETEDGEEIAVGYKDCRVIFGKREDIQDYYSGVKLF